MMGDNDVNFTEVARWEQLVDDWPNGFADDADNWPTFCGERIEINVLRYLSDAARYKISPSFRESYTGDPADVMDQVDWEWENSQPPN